MLKIGPRTDGAATAMAPVDLVNATGAIQNLIYSSLINLLEYA